MAADASTASLPTKRSLTSPATPRSALARHTLARAVQALEAEGPLDDAVELREAARAAGDLPARVLLRGQALGERLGLDAAWHRLMGGGKLAALLLALTVAFASLAAAHAVVGQERSVNAVAAFVSVLGVHALTLALWLLGLLLARPFGAHARASFGGAAASLGGWALQLGAWLAGRGQTERARALLTGMGQVLARGRAGFWLTSAISHGIWALAFTVIGLGLWWAFSFRAYQLSWESTILDAGFFARFVELTGRLPALLGFPVPDAGQLAGTGQVPNRDWAWWLMGAVWIYGCLPRAALALTCALRFRQGLARLAVDEADPYVRQLATRFAALDAQARVVDAEQAAPRPALAPAAPGVAGGDAVLLGWELPPGEPLPPELGAAPGLAWTESLDGAAAGRERVLARLSAHPGGAPRVLLVCRAAGSPDRGTARFLRDLARVAAQSALLPLAALPAGGGAQRWKDWLDAEQLTPRWPMLADLPQAVAWLGGEQSLGALP